MGVGSGFKNIAVALQLDTAGFDVPLDKAGAKVDAFGAKMKAANAEAVEGGGRVSGALIGVGAAATAVGAGLLAVGVKAASTFESYGMSVRKLQLVTGGTAQEMSKLNFAAEETGIGTDTLTNSFKFLSRNLVNKPQEFQAYGIATVDAKGKQLDLNDVFLNTVEALHNMTDATQRNAAAVAIFGRSGTQLLPILLQGKEGMMRLEEEAQKYGLVLTQNNVDAVYKATLAHRQLDAAMQGLQIQIGEKFLPVLTTATTDVANFIAKSRGGIATFVEWGAGILLVAGPLSSLIGVMIRYAAAVAGNAASTLTWVGSLGQTAAAETASVEPVDALTAAFTEQGFVLGTLPTTAADYVASLAEVDTAEAGAGSAALGLVAGLGFVAVAVGAAVVLYNAWDSANRDAAKATADFTATLNTNTGAITTNSQAYEVKALAPYADDLQKAKVGLGDLNEAVESNSKFMSVANIAALDEAGGKTKLVEVLRSEGGARNDLLATIIQAAGLNPGLIRELEQEWGAHDKLKGSLDAQKKSAEALVGANGDQVGSIQDVITATQDYQAVLKGTLDPLFALQDAAETQAKNQALVAQYTRELANAERQRDPKAVAAATQKLADAQSAAVRSAEQLQIATGNMTDALARNPAALQGDIDRMNSWVSQGIITRAEADQQIAKWEQVAGAVNNIPGGKRITLAIEDAQAKREIQAIYNRISGLTGKVWTAFVTTKLAPHGYGGARAAGGPVMANTPYLTAEQGPEVYQPNHGPAQVLSGIGMRTFAQPGVIVSNQQAFGHQAPGWSGGGSGPSFVVQIQARADNYIGDRSELEAAICNTIDRKVFGDGGHRITKAIIDAMGSVN